MIGNVAPSSIRALTATFAAVMCVHTSAFGFFCFTYSTNFGYIMRAQIVPPPQRNRPVKVYRQVMS